MKLHLPEKIKTMNALMEFDTEKVPEKLAVTFHSPALNEHSSITYFELSKKTGELAFILKEQGLELGDRALLIYPPGIDLIIAFYACLRAGVVAVPVYPPQNMKLAQKMTYLLGDVKPAAILSNHVLKKSLIQYLPPKIPCLFSDEMHTDISWSHPRVNENTLAFLQYTSGSTHYPKGVQVSHKNILENFQILYQGTNLSEVENIVSWLPPYHDMGLIGCILLPLSKAITTHLTSPLDFMLDPASWLKMLTKHRKAATAGPNFSLAYCTHKIQEEQKQILDLSEVVSITISSEPVRCATMDSFYQAFAPCGLRKESLLSAYGLAEATLAISFKSYYHPDFRISLSSKALRENQIQVALPAEEETQTLVSAGKPFTEVKIVNPHTLELCPEDTIGEIWLQGPTVSRGYWNQPDETALTFHAKIDKPQRKYLRTGDLGFLHQGELYPLGRIKDLIIIHGRNYYPQDIEDSIENCDPQIRSGCVIAFSLEEDKEEKLVILCETKELLSAEKTQELVNRMCYTIATEYNLAIRSLVFIANKSLPKTTSGKLQRHPSKEAFLQGKLDILYQWDARSGIQNHER